MPIEKLTISIVSHGQSAIVQKLLADLSRYAHHGNFRVVLTLNIPERLPGDSAAMAYPLTIVRNAVPKGFGANHNSAFRLSIGNYFCVLNPDIRLPENPFPKLMELLEDPGVGLAAPAITDSSGQFEDSARRFPTPFLIFDKILGHLPKIDYDMKARLVHPDWVAGMFMFFSSTAFQRAKGFDERYFLYYEDVDLCARMRLMGYRIIMCPSTRAVHDARRHSHRNLRHMRWHLASMLNFFLSHVFLKVMKHRY
jgi:N-acetylglucosaminyl-diphospho-decaprenol L-rhamnosyltransferase